MSTTTRTSEVYSSVKTGWQLGAPLYVPALHPDLLKIANAEKIPLIKSMIICTEDAVAEKDLLQSIANLKHFLPLIQRIESRYRFIRVRNPETLKRILDLPGIENIDGFVLPKFDLSNSDAYHSILFNTRFRIMPTLETIDVFNPAAMRDLALTLAASTLKNNIVLLRIGGNDLLNLIGMRRPRGVSLYETPLAHVIAQLVTTFKPLGFPLSAPVYEYLDDTETLDREIRADLAYGLIGKTAIHPTQIPMIQRHYRVAKMEYEQALDILNTDSPAVFKRHQAMCEISTHTNWARQIVARYDYFGLDDPDRCQTEKSAQHSSIERNLLKNADTFSIFAPYAN